MKQANTADFGQTELGGAILNFAQMSSEMLTDVSFCLTLGK